MQMDYAKWNMSFETGTNMFFDDIGLAVEYAVLPPDHLELWSTSDTVYYGDTLDVDIVPCGADSLFSPLGIDDDYKFAIKIQESSLPYGHLLHQGASGSYFENIPSVDRIGKGLQFVADGIEPDSSVELSFGLAAEFVGNSVPCRIGNAPDSSQRDKVPVVVKLMRKQNASLEADDKEISSSAKRPLKLMGRILTADKGPRPAGKISIQNKLSKATETLLLRQKMEKRRVGRLVAADARKKPGPRINSKISASVSSIADPWDWSFIPYLASIWSWGEKEHEILLGETIYYQAIPDPKDKTGKRLNFKEMSETKDWTPGGQPAQFTVTPETPKEKLGVYYEFKDNDGLALAGDMIRLVGRYWRQDQTYEVRLKATSGERSGSIKVVVKKPGRLGDTFNKANNYNGDSFDLDDLIFEYAGREGIMPQYIKGLISTETMGLFDPCFRYEPFKDLEILQAKNRAGKCEYESNTSYSHYRILSVNDKGTPSIPTNHSNIRDASCVKDRIGERIQYPGYQNLWDFYWSHLDFYSLTHYSGNNVFEKHWEAIYPKVLEELLIDRTDDLTDADREIASDTTDARFFQWIRYEYNGGASNMVAQTRISASYGILQLLYVGGEEYPQNNGSYRPEDINDHAVGFQYGIQHLIGKFNKSSVLNGHFADATWQNGLEAKYKKAIGYYNGAGDTYANDVFSRASNFQSKP
jgi:hypothetical protein